MPKNGIEGIHYMINPYEQYAGLKVTAENRRQYINAFKQDFIEAHKEKVESGELTNEQLLAAAEKYGRDHVNFHKKMEKAHTKGRAFFHFHGRRERVVTAGVVTKLQKYMQELEERYVAEQSKQEEE